jgi:hypothetical protein
MVNNFDGGADRVPIFHRPSGVQIVGAVKDLRRPYGTRTIVVLAYPPVELAGYFRKY